MSDAQASIFEDNELTEPDYSGQVVAQNKEGSGNKHLHLAEHKVQYLGCSSCHLIMNSAPFNERRVFKRLDSKETELEPWPDRYGGIWEDRSGEQFFWSDLRDIVIINKGVKL